MRRRRFFIVTITFLVLPAGCFFSDVTEFADLLVTGDATVDDKVTLAREVINASIEAGLHSKIRARFPNALDDQLKQLEVRYVVTNSQKVTIRCSITLPKPMETTATIVDYCRELLLNEFTSRLKV